MANQEMNVTNIMEDVPVIDLLHGGHSTNVALLDAALRRFGFFYVKNHGVETALIEKQFQVAAKLFDLPLDTKRSMPFDGTLDIGYVGSGGQALDQESNDTAIPDTKEQFMMTNNKLVTDPSAAASDPDDVFEGSNNFAVPQIPEHAETVKAYMSAVYKLNVRLNELLFDAMGGDMADAQKRAAAKYSAKPFCVLKQMKYAGEPSDPSQGKFGAGAHADWGSFTILATDQTPGLQIHMPHNNNSNNTNSNDQQWLPVPPKPDCFIINSGNQIAHLTNDIYRSAVHRVVTVSSQPRFSTAVFTYFSLDAVVAPLSHYVTTERPARYPLDRTTLQYFHFKLHESFGTKKT